MTRSGVKLLLCLLTASMAFGVTVPCNSGVSDVTTLTGANNCNIGAYLFGNFTVSLQNNGGFGAGFKVGIVTTFPDTGISGSSINIGFQLGPFTGPATGDLLLTYTITGGTNGADTNFQASPGPNGGSITLLERVCDGIPSSTASCAGSAGTLLQFNLTSTGDAVTAIAPYAGGVTRQLVTVQKDISFNSASMSEFINSAEIPEPLTLSLIGGGLLGFGLLRRFRRPA